MIEATKGSDSQVKDFIEQIRNAAVGTHHLFVTQKERLRLAP